MGIQFIKLSMSKLLLQTVLFKPEIRSSKCPVYVCVNQTYIENGVEKFGMSK